jgi:hypothetical protein
MTPISLLTLLVGVVASGGHDGGQYRYAIAAPGCHRVAGTSHEPYAFRLSCGGSALRIAPLQVDNNPTAIQAARAYLESAHGQLRAVHLDAHHAELVDRAGRPRYAFVDAGGPFRIVFTVHAGGRGGEAFVDAMAHGSRFDWTGPDVLHLQSDPAAARLVAAADAAMASQDSYRVTTSSSGAPLFVIERLRSQQYEGDTLYLSTGAMHLLTIGDREYEQLQGESCWRSRSQPPVPQIFDAVSEPVAGPRVAYGPVTQSATTLGVQETRWDLHAIRLETVLSFDAATKLLLSRSAGSIVDTYEWVPVTVPPAPQPLCPPPPPPP